MRLYDIASNKDSAIPIALASDFDHLREHWVPNPMQYLTSAHVAPDGAGVVLTARGQAFVAPVKQGRFINVAPHQPGRFRDARYAPDGKSLVLLSTESGEVELWKAPANGVGAREQLTKDGTVLRWDAIPSPDGKWIVHHDKNAQLWLFDTATKAEKKIATADTGGNSFPDFGGLTWSPDSKWLAYSLETENLLSQILLYNVETGTTTPLTTDRYDNSSPAWSSDGKWIYFISDRNLRSEVFSPWGSRQPDPYFDRSDKIYQVALKKAQRSPFAPPDELHPDKPEKKEEPKTESKPAESKPAEGKAAETKPTETKAPEAKPSTVKVEIDLDGLVARLEEVPVPPGDYSDLAVAGKRLCWIAVARAGEQTHRSLECLEIANKGEKPDTVMEDVRGFEVSGDGKKMLIAKQNDLYVVDATAKGSALKDSKALTETQVDLKSWSFSVIPSDEFKEEFQDAWRLHRDYFYDRNMHGVNWNAMRQKYVELIPRVRDREELSDVIAEMVAELATLHTFVRGGDIRKGPDQVQLASLGARLERDKQAGGYVVSHIYRYDPDRPDQRPPLARPEAEVAEGDTIVSIDGQGLLALPDPAELLRNKAGKQVLLRVKPKGKAETRDVIISAVSMQDDSNYRYNEWEYTRRLMVDEASKNSIGYVHLRAMGSNDINRWVEQYSPVFTRAGLIIDVRHNNGGNIDSWILGKLLRKAWMYWQPRVGHATWNMQQAFRGQMVVLCDQETASDGEAFSEGFRRLGLGKVIGMRTWGGEIWLTSSNFLADRGIATTGENGVFGPEGKWLIEGHGVDPDTVVDNLPHATFEGKDAQLEAAIAYLQERMKEKPLAPPKPPEYPDKSFKYSGSK